MLYVKFCEKFDISICYAYIRYNYNSDLGSTGSHSRPNSDPGGINSPHTPSNQGMIHPYYTRIHGGATLPEKEEI